MSEFASQLDQMQVDSDWKFMHLLVYLCKDEMRTEDFLAWLEAKSTGDLYELMADYSRQFPEDMAEFREKALNIFSKWNGLRNSGMSAGGTKLPVILRFGIELPLNIESVL